MSLFEIGVDHHGCPVTVREAMVVTGEAELQALRRLMENPLIDEAVILSTCARTEIYLSSGDDAAVTEARALLQQLNPSSVPYFRVRRGRELVSHLFRVAAGIESQIVGEHEIGGQVRAAVAHARETGALGPALDSLFRAAIRCGRRIRRDTAIGQVDASVARTASKMARNHLDVHQASVLVIGAGRIARLLLEELADACELTVANRSLGSAESIATGTGASVLSLHEATARLDQFDIVCCATRARTPVLEARHFTRPGPKLVFDLSVPRNVTVGDGLPPGVMVYDIDAVRAPAPRDQEDLALVDSIISAEVHDFLSRESIQRVGPIIHALRAHVDEVRQSELDRVAKRLAGLSERERSLTLELTERLIDRMFHHLVVRLRLAALTDPDLIKAAEFFFAHGEDSLFPVDDAGAGDESNPHIDSPMGRRLQETRTLS